VDDGIPVSVSFIPRAEYDRIDAINWSKLKVLGRSPAHFRAAMLGHDKDTDARKFGRVGHLAVLEPERYRKEVVVWDGGKRDKRIKAYADFLKAHAGQEIITPKEDELARTIGEVVRRDKQAALLLSQGRSEQTILWKHKNGMAAKGRIDFLAREGVVDLKFARDASPVGFGRAAASIQHHVQASYYLDGLESCGVSGLSYFCVAVEIEPPFAVSVYRVGEVLLDMGREVYGGLLEQLKECRETNNWPGYTEGVQELQLPTWAYRDDDVTGIGLDFELEEAHG
jgi:hypothetical protein